jgi:hypothetical protein
VHLTVSYVVQYDISVNSEGSRGGDTVKYTTVVSVLLFLWLAAPVIPSAATQHPELGTVTWHRNLEYALDLAGRQNRPVFILFQEVPGCSTCDNYGRSVLSHPLIVEAIETLFVPLAVFNNRGGEDAEVLRMFGEPAWNNPVVRITDHRRRELINRLSGDYSIAGTAGAMIEALEQIGRPVPKYLKIVYRENESFIAPERVVLATGCFWSGELGLGEINGVVATTAGFMRGREVVDVRFDESVVPLSELLRQAKRRRNARTVYVYGRNQEKIARSVVGEERVKWATSFRPDSETKYYLSQTSYRFLPLTPLQAIHINRAVYDSDDPDQFLSPGQRALLSYIRDHREIPWRNRIHDDDFTESWYEIMDEVNVQH